MSQKKSKSRKMNGKKSETARKGKKPRAIALGISEPKLRGQHSGNGAVAREDKPLRAVEQSQGGRRRASQGGSRSGANGNQTVFGASAFRDNNALLVALERHSASAGLRGSRALEHDACATTIRADAVIVALSARCCHQRRLRKAPLRPGGWARFGACDPREGIKRCILKLLACSTPRPFYGRGRHGNSGRVDKWIERKETMPSGRRSSHSGEQATRIMRPGAVLTSPYSEEFG